MCTYFKTETDVAQNLIDDFFFLILPVRGPFHRNDFKSIKIGAMGLLSEKTEALYAEWKQPPAVILQQAIFLQCSYSVLAAKNDHKI